MFSRRSLSTVRSFGGLQIVYILISFASLFAAGCLETEMSRNAIQGAMSEFKNGISGASGGKGDGDPFSHESLKADLP